ncbi:kinesin motor domain-containing protein [Xylariaceae sp. FL0016]|nr:kinesin motor domain-containing protein [Xylariaceae sp. FL0016]
MAGGGNIKVVVRVRPFNSREIDRGAKRIVDMKGNQTVLTPPNEAAHSGKGAKDGGPKTFAFDRSYWSFNKSDSNYAGQENLHDDLGKPLLDNAFQGYNNCIFAYGQTGSGKSYSMMGYGAEHGIIPKICQDMFGRIDGLQSDSSTKCTVEVSYLEIYNERVRDLLNPSTKGNLKVREHPSTGPYVEDLAKLVVGSFQEIENLMDEGNKARTVAATNMNETSSRSHAVFTLILTQKSTDADTKMELEKQAKISLVDLAGSERATSTGATGARLKEGAEINRSLSTLGRVIAALADLSTGKKKKGAGNTVPYRDSVLTWLLKDSLGGNSMTAMIAAISPADINYDETLSTLRYADSAKRIKNHAVINEDANARMIRELKEELALLRSKMGGGTVGGVSGAGGAAPEEVYDPDTPLEKQIVSITSADGTVKKVSKAEIAEQLSQSEKLLTDLNQTWEEKLVKTEEIHKEREAALEELGISIEKGFVGLHTPKKMPHLVNLSDDPLLAECLVYNLKPGKTTVGNVDSNAEHQANIRLNGTRILHDHCSFDNAADGTVTITPNEGASIMVNGRRISEPTRLHSGYRVILGDFHIFRFNHPMEAKAERDENRQSLLRQSVTASQLQNLDRASPSPRPGHERTLSKAGSELGDSRPDSPALSRNGRDTDWSFARREAAGAILGTDKNLSSLTDEELNALFADVQRARAERVNDRDGDDDLESNMSYPFREKYMSTGTIDNFSLDTALTMPSTPKAGDSDDRLKEIRESMQSQLEKQKEEYQDQIQSAEAANVEVEEIKQEKVRMEETLSQLKADMQRQLDEQKQKFEAKIEKLDPLKRPKAKPKLSADEIKLAKNVMKHWRSRHYVRMAEAVLQHAATLKEAQIMSEELGENVVFQFTVIDQGHALCSTYDMILNDVSTDSDLALEQSQKPCVGVRVVDYKNAVIHLWSLEKLHDRVRQMRQMHQYLDQPEYCQHFKLDNPFVETCMPQFSLVGEVDVPLKAVFDSRVQDFTLDVLSPHTSHAIGIIKVSLEPSSARAPSSTLKYNVVMHDMVGFAEREGTDVHAQLFIPGVSENGMTTTQMIKDFDEGPVRFDSVHSMSVPLFGPQDANLRIAIFAKVSTMHLDKLLSWDDMRDNTPGADAKQQGARISESQFYTQEKHDILARIQVLEMNENGEYVPMEVTQTSELDVGTFQLHQGLQRRIAINLTHSSGDALPWEDVSSVRVGKVQLVDHSGKVPDLASPTPEISLRIGTKPTLRQNANGTRSLTVTGHWDSSLHNSLLLDRTTADKYKIQLTLAWDICSDNLAEPMKFSTDLYCQILGRNYVRQASMLSSLWQHVRIVHSSTAIFTLGMKPAPIKRMGDLWRMSSQHDYVKGEENLTNWTPRGVSLIGDFIAARKKKRRITEIGAVQLFLKKIGLPEPKRRPSEYAQNSEDDLSPTKVRDDDEDSINALLNDTPESSRPGTPTQEIPSEEQDDKNDGAAAHTQETDDVQPSEGDKNSETTEAPGTSESAGAHESNGSTEPTVKPTQSEFDEAEATILAKCVDLWKRHPDPSFKVLSPTNTAPPTNGVAPESTEAPRLIATVVRVPKNPTVLKGGYLLVPNADSTKWVKRFVELRRPYMHLHNCTDGDEVAIVSLRNSRVDSQPEILALFNGHDDDGVDGEISSNNGGSIQPGHRRTSSGRVISTIWSGNPGSSGPGLGGLSERLQAGVFAVYGTDNTWLFAARNEREKLDWIFRIDQSYYSGSGSVSGSGAVSPQPRSHAFHNE